MFSQATATTIIRHTDAFFIDSLATQDRAGGGGYCNCIPTLGFGEFEAIRRLGILRSTQGSPFQNETQDVFENTVAIINVINYR